MSAPARNYIDLIVRHEGYKPYPYCDRCGARIVRQHQGWFCACRVADGGVGNMTVGCGLNLEVHGLTLAEAREVTGNRARDLMNGLSVFRWFADLDAVRRAAICDLAYNLGTAGVLRFGEMIAALSLSDWSSAAMQLRQSRATAQEPRRIAELASMLETGNWPEGDF